MKLSGCGSLIDTPVLEMALDFEHYTQQVQSLVAADRLDLLEYTMLKIAMEIQDKSTMNPRSN